MSHPEELLADCSWSIGDKPSVAVQFGQDSNAEDTPYPLDKIYVIGKDTIYILYQVDRFGELDLAEIRYPLTSGQVTSGQLLKWIYDFYHTPVDRDLVEKIASIDCVLNYSKLAQERLDANEPLQLHEVMGNCLFFEGLRECRSAHNTGDDYVSYILYLGS